jgi:stage II sporulation protein P
VNINGKDCAKILFVIGLEYDTYQNNLKAVEEINNIINAKYPNLSRGIMKKQGYGVNGVYNQDLGSNVILIEIGGHENNIDEVNNTLDLVADAIKEYLNEKK